MLHESLKALSRRLGSVAATVVEPGSSRSTPIRGIPMTTSPARTDNPGSSAVTRRGESGELAPAGAALTHSATGLPPGVRISPDGALSGAVRALGTHTVTLTTAAPGRV